MQRRKIHVFNHCNVYIVPITIMTIIIIYFGWKQKRSIWTQKWQQFVTVFKLLLSVSFFPRLHAHRVHLSHKLYAPMYGRHFEMKTAPNNESRLNVSVMIIYFLTVELQLHGIVLLGAVSSSLKLAVCSMFATQAKVTHLKNCREMKATLHKIRYNIGVMLMWAQRDSKRDKEKEMETIVSPYPWSILRF